MNKLSLACILQPLFLHDSVNFSSYSTSKHIFLAVIVHKKFCVCPQSLPHLPSLSRTSISFSLLGALRTVNRLPQRWPSKVPITSYVLAYLLNLTVMRTTGALKYRSFSLCCVSNPAMFKTRVYISIKIDVFFLPHCYYISFTWLLYTPPYALKYCQSISCLCHLVMESANIQEVEFVLKHKLIFTPCHKIVYSLLADVQPYFPKHMVTDIFPHSHLDTFDLSNVDNTPLRKTQYLKGWPPLFFKAKLPPPPHLDPTFPHGIHSIRTTGKSLQKTSLESSQNISTSEQWKMFTQQNKNCDKND